ncbi:MAG: hypothetical protein LPJ87_08610 [Zoogloeaceae bacterium]|nr:hypothetical protein [Zoogloeaceae bacterium]
MRILMLAAASALISACASSPVMLADYSSTTQLDRQHIGETQTRKIGEVLVAKGQRTEVPALQVLNTTIFNKAAGEASIMTCAVTAVAGIYPKRGTYREGGGDCFGPVMVQLTLADGTTNWNCPGQSWLTDICKGGDEYFVALLSMKAPLKQQFENLKPTTMLVGGKPNLVQELIYTGRMDRRIGITYREFSNDIERPSFVQELQYDLGESQEIVFRSVRLQVLKADAGSITYRAIAGFETPTPVR